MTRLLDAAVAIAIAASASAAKPKPTKTPALTPPTQQELLGQAAMEIATNDLAAAEKAARKGLAAYPAAQGFHFDLGEVFNKQGKYAEAFYEYQWEFARDGAGTTDGDLAAARIKAILDESRGAETAEVSDVVAAVANTTSDPKGALAALQKVRAKRGARFGLDLLIAEAQVAAAQFPAAEASYQSLLKRDPFCIPTYVEYAAMLDRAGKSKQAEQLREDARAKAPFDPRLAQATPAPPPATPKP